MSGPMPALPRPTSRWRAAQLVWLPVPIALGFLFAGAGQQVTFGAPNLSLALEILLRCLGAPILFLAGQNYLARREKGFLFIAASVLLAMVMSLFPFQVQDSPLGHGVALMAPGLGALCLVAGTFLLSPPADGPRHAWPSLALALGGGLAFATPTLLAARALAKLPGLPPAAGWTLHLSLTAILAMLVAGALFAARGRDLTLDTFQGWLAMTLLWFAAAAVARMVTVEPASMLGWSNKVAKVLGTGSLLGANLWVQRANRRLAQPLEAALQQTEARYRSLFNGMTEAFALHELLLDEAGRPFDYRVLELNPAFEHLTGMPREEVLGKTHRDNFPGHEPPCLHLFGEVAMTGHPVAFIQQWPELERCYEGTAYVAGPLQFATIFKDITERRRTEGALAQAYAQAMVTETTLQATVLELERSNRELGQFAYVASHDLQEPLRQVLVMIDLLNVTLAGRLDGKEIRHLTMIQEGARRMADLVQGLLEYSRVGFQGAPGEPVSAQDALDGALAILRGPVAATGARITQDPLPAVSAEPAQLTRVFQNLLSNALKFHPQGVPPRIHVGYRVEAGQGTFRIQDHGLGIEPRYHDKIFQIFQRLHDREAYPGTGIGLAICKKIVEQHGGSIWVESLAGDGTTFCFTLGKPAL